jgi:hypothetical protein
VQGGEEDRAVLVGEARIENIGFFPLGVVYLGAI